jgi:hypothetical protein
VSHLKFGKKHGEGGALSPHWQIIIQVSCCGQMGAHSGCCKEEHRAGRAFPDLLIFWLLDILCSHMLVVTKLGIGALLFSILLPALPLNLNLASQSQRANMISD